MAEEIKKESPEELQELTAEAVVVEEEAVIVPLSHYEELVANSVKMSIILQMYQNISSYDYDSILQLIFGKKPKDVED